MRSKVGEKGKKTLKRFSYNSANNKKFLTIKEIQKKKFEFYKFS